MYYRLYESARARVRVCVYTRIIHIYNFYIHSRAAGTLMNAGKTSERANERESCAR